MSIVKKSKYLTPETSWIQLLNHFFETFAGVVISKRVAGYIRRSQKIDSLKSIFRKRGTWNLFFTATVVLQRQSGN